MPSCNVSVPNFGHMYPISEIINPKRGKLLAVISIIFRNFDILVQGYMSLFHIFYYRQSWIQFLSHVFLIILAALIDNILRLNAISGVTDMMVKNPEVKN